MGKPAMSSSMTRKHLTKQEKKNKAEVEERLKGNNNKIKAPTYLSKTQKTLFKYIVKEMCNAEILGNLDIYVLSTCAISIDRLQHIEELINDNIEALQDRKLMASRKEYESALFRCMNELCMTPQSRAKLGNLNIQTQNMKNDALMKALHDDEEEEDYE